MTRARRRIALFALLPVFAAAAIVIGGRHDAAPTGSAPAAMRPKLFLLTSLPLVFSEEFSISGSGSPVLRRLQVQYRVTPISITSDAELAKGQLLMMAQPQAEAPEDLVALDHWVRGGGHLLLFADPMLEWPSKLPLGDRTRAPPMFVDTGLLAHWGLRLDAPDVRGPAARDLGGYQVLTVSPGALYGRCKITPDKLVAHCAIERGELTVVADADLLNVDQLGAGAKNNIDGVLAELATLTHS